MPRRSAARICLKLADLISQNLEELGHLEALDTGKPVKKATGEIWFAAGHYRYYAGWATKLEARRSFDLSLQADPYHCVTLRQPVGVVAGIIAWNFSVRPGKLEGCSSAGGWLHNDSEACGTDTAYRITACGALR